MSEPYLTAMIFCPSTPTQMQQKMNTAAPTIMDALPDELILVLMGVLKDSRGLGFTCAHMYRLYRVTPDRTVFDSVIGRNSYNNAAKVAPAKLYLLIPPPYLYAAGNLPCLKALWRHGFGIKRHFLSRLFNNRTRQKQGGAALAEWMWAHFADVLVDTSEGPSWAEDVIRAGHSELFEKIVAAGALCGIDAELIITVRDLRTFKLVYGDMPAGDRKWVCSRVRDDTPTYVVAYLSMLGEPLIAENVRLFAYSIEHIRAVRLSDVLEYYDELLAVVANDGSNYVLKWLKSLRQCRRGSQ